MDFGESKEFLKLAMCCHKLGKKAGAKLEKAPKKDEKVEMLELDELCVNFLKNIWLWTSVDRAQSGLSAFRSALEKQNTPKNF